MPSSLLKFVVLPVTVALASCAAKQAPVDTEFADILLTNGTVYTMNAERDWADAVAIRDGRIVFVGTSTEAKKLAGDKTQIVDLKQQMVLPSFQDVHIHPMYGGLAYTGCALFDATDMAAVKATIAGCIEDNPDAAFIQGAGWDWGLFIDEPPHKTILDEISTDIPLIMGDSDGHTLWLNSKALEFAGISKEMPDPEGGEIGRDETSGELTGTLLEGPAMQLISDKLPPISMAQKEAALIYAQDYFNSLGITAIQDAYAVVVGNESDRPLAAYKSLE